jgi:hypothetical protein
MWMEEREVGVFLGAATVEPEEVEDQEGRSI